MCRRRKLVPRSAEHDPATGRMKLTDVTVHGFRSSFRDWTGNETHFPRDLAEAALAHVIGDKAEQAYRRGEALAKRRALMDDWAAYCKRSAVDQVQKALPESDVVLTPA